MRREDDHVIQEAKGLLVVEADHLVDQLHELVCAQHFGGVEPTVDPHDGLPLPGESPSVLVGQTFGKREAPGNVPEAVQARVVLGRGKDRHELGAPLRRVSDRVEGHPRRFLGQLLPVRRQLCVGREEVIGSDLVIEFFHGARYRVLRAERSLEEEGDGEGDNEGEGGGERGSEAASGHRLSLFDGVRGSLSESLPRIRRYPNNSPRGRSTM